jgi:hypothetical protein
MAVQGRKHLFANLFNMRSRMEWMQGQELLGAQQQGGSSGGAGFLHGLSNLLHGHSWNYVKAGVATEQGPGSATEPNPIVTAVNDAVGLFGVVAPKIASELHLGPIGAGVSIWNDPSKENKINTGLGLVSGPAWAIMGPFTDFLDWGANNSNPLAGKTWQDENPSFSGNPGSGDSGDGGTREGGGGTYDLGECQRQGLC